MGQADATAIFVPPPLAAEAILDVRFSTRKELEN